MGLDMFVFSTKQKLNPSVDFPIVDDEGENVIEQNELFYWRKHPNLHGWMHQLYIAKGGRYSDPNDFNYGVGVVIESGDLDLLEHDLKTDDLPETEGFFFGRSSPEDDKTVYRFIKKAREALKQGLTLYYTAWW